MLTSFQQNHEIPVDFFFASKNSGVLSSGIMTEYPKHARSTGNRYKSRLTYDFAAVHSIVNACSILHVSFVPSQDDPFPTILPMIGQMGSFTNQTADPSLEVLDLYVHGSSSSRLMKLPASSPHGEGLPVCVAATLLDGIVLALTPFNHSCNFRSAVLHGYASVVDNEAEKFWAMELITDGLVPGRWVDTRLPSKAEMQSTTILKIRVESASAKARTGGPGDNRKDLNDEAVVKKVWAGVVPVHEQLGEVCEGEKNGAGKCPEYIERWMKEKNQKAEGYAKEVAVLKKD